MTPAPPSVHSIAPASAPTTQAVAALEELREQLEGTQRALSAKQAELRTVLVQRDARIAEVALLQRELETVRQAHAARIDELERTSADRIEELERTSADRIEELERALAERNEELERALANARQQPAPGDDLQLIRGIGPAFARELKRLGVRTFEQIAAWTDEDVRTIAPQIKAKVERIRRDDWPGNAAQLIAQRARR